MAPEKLEISSDMLSKNCSDIADKSGIKVGGVCKLVPLRDKKNIRKTFNIKLINNSKDYVRCVSKPNLISQKIFSKNSIVVHQMKSVLTLDKPICGI